MGEIIDQLSSGWVEDSDFVLELAEEARFAATYQFGETGTGEQIASVAGMIEARQAPFGIADFQAHAWGELLLLAHATFSFISCVERHGWSRR
ncbi:MAG: hypothetical protein UMU75_07115 [Halomonas sp.]|nr:hypothetical protein [Halomonas sp.]